MKRTLVTFLAAATFLVAAAPTASARPIAPGTPGATNCTGRTITFLARGGSFDGLTPARGLARVAKVNHLSVRALMELVGVHCTPAPRQLDWNSPAEIHLEVPATYSSIDPCPSGTDAVFVTLLFLPSGASTFGPIPVAADGAWSADLAFGAVVPADPATANAGCFGPVPNAPPIATYEPHPVTILP